MALGQEGETEMFSKRPKKPQLEGELYISENLCA